MNRYPWWKYAILAIALVVGLLYTLPNVFGEAPAVQISSGKPTLKLDSSMTQRVSQVLASAVGQIALVVRAGKTSQRTVLDALSHLGNGRTVSLILNQAEGVAGDRYYYGYNNETRSPSERES